MLAAYHGGFEIRVRPGGPGEGVLHNIDLGDPAVAIACLSPLSTSHFLESRMINGIGSRMVGEMKQRRDAGTFHRLSMKFARGVGIVTPEMGRRRRRPEAGRVPVRRGHAGRHRIQHGAGRGGGRRDADTGGVRARCSPA